MYDNTAAVVVFYPSAEKYFSTFINSISNQNTKNFVLIVANDGCSNLEKYFEDCDFEKNIISISGTPTSIRVKLIKYLIKQNEN